MYKYEYKEINLNQILELLKKGAVVSIIAKCSDNCIDDPVYLASTVKGEKTFVELDDLAHLNRKKELNDLKNIIQSIFNSKKNRVAKIFYVRVSIYSDPLLTLEYK